MPEAGIEPWTFGSEVQRANHYAMEALALGTADLKIELLDLNYIYSMHLGPLQSLGELNQTWRLNVIH